MGNVLVIAQYPNQFSKASIQNISDLETLEYFLKFDQKEEHSKFKIS